MEYATIYRYNDRNETEEGVCVMFSTNINIHEQIEDVYLYLDLTTQII